MFQKAKSKNNRMCYRSARDMKLTALRQPSPVDVFLFQRHSSPTSAVESFRCTSDIYMLFNQQRLDRMSREALLNYFNNMSVSEPSMTALKSKLTDDQLISLVKSRYIQQPSELLSYSMYLNSLADSELKSLAVAAQAAQAAKVVDASQNKSAPDAAGAAVSE